MATKKRGLIDQAMASQPVAAAKRIIDKAVDAFEKPPLAPDPLTTKARRPPAKKATARQADRKLVSTMEDYEVKYLAQKWSVTQKAVKEAVARVGHSRNKVEAELKRARQ